MSEQTPPSTPPQAPQGFFAKLWHDVIRPYGEAILFAVLVTTFLFTLVAVQGNSMLPNLRTGERVFIPKYETWFHRFGIGDFKRGDILVFKPPADTPGLSSSVGGLWSYTPFFIKRLVGLPGDKIRIENGEVYLNGAKLDQSFTTDFWQKQGCWDTDSELARNITPLGSQEFTIPEGNYFVMGDNRTARGSEDSRMFGTITYKNIAGRAAFVVWPIARQPELSFDCQGDPSQKPTISGAYQINWRILGSPAGFGKVPPAQP